MDAGVIFAPKIIGNWKHVRKKARWRIRRRNIHDSATAGASVVAVGILPVPYSENGAIDEVS